MSDGRIERKAPRFLTQVRIFFTAGEKEGEGVVLDISKGGCRVRCESDLSVGTEIDAQIYFPDYDWPLKVQRAIVRWINVDVFGIEFLDLLPAQRERLRVLLAEKKFKIG
ncbi:MAG: PilZ domain-containing protein [Nitrospiraceae bacterium]